ncbi:MAG: type IV pilus assembly protein PilM [Planctomycetes bacterium]|nr:type IV pilus assembly protein PilM [Planctomycetota bacterium]
MPKRKGYSPIGIDLQAGSAKMVQLHFGPKGTSLVGCKAVTFEESLTRIVDQKPEKIVDQLKQAITSAGLSGRRAIATLPAAKVDVRTLTLAGSEDDLEKLLRWEAESYLHYEVADASIDHAKLGEVSAGNEKRSEVMVATANKTYIREVMDLLSEAGLMVQAIDIVPMALWRLGIRLAEELEAPVSMIDIGRTSSVAVILSRGDLRLTRTMARGGEELTSRIMQGLDIDRNEAELLKKEYGTGMAGGAARFGSQDELVTKTEVAGTIHEILRHDLEDIADELRKLFRYFSTQNKGMAVGRGYLCGGGGRLKGLDAYFTERIGVAIEQLPALDVVLKAKNNPDDETGPEYAVAAGLALRVDGKE